ncbi:MAG: copper homeostasis protein CutC [bacterium]
MILEVCANSYQSAINAQKAGAHRIELCKDLHLGGLTPDIETFKKVRQELTIPIYVLIRPRSGNFVYSEDEFNTILSQIETFKSLSADGIVCGTLDSKNRLHISQTQLLIQKSQPLEFTYHRAFDEVANPHEAILKLEQMGACRVLTSGQANSAVEGLQFLIELKKLVKKTNILPGAGINETNAHVFVEKRFKEIHASCSIPHESTTISGFDKIQNVLAVLNS